MNFASWVILGIVIAVVVLAARATFSKKPGKNPCCGDCRACHACPSLEEEHKA